MAKKAEVKEVALKASQTGFTLIGEVKMTDNTFPKESVSKNDYISRRLNLGVKVDEGKVSYSEMFGGFNGNDPRPIFVFTKKEEGEEKGKMSEVQWDDRILMGEDEAFMSKVADFSTITVALEKDASGKTFYKRFLSAYDAISYIEAHLKDGDKVKVKGKLTPNYYNGKTTLRKEITFIGLAKEEETPVAKGYIQVLVDENSVGKTRFKQDDELDISAFMVAYASKIDNVEVKRNIPYPINLILPIQTGNEDKLVRGKVKKILEQLAIKGDKVNEIKFEVAFEEGVVVREATLDDLDKDSRELVDAGIISLEDAIGKVSVSGGRMNRVVITAPATKKEEVNGKNQVRIDWEQGKYTTDDIAFDFNNVAPKVNEEVTKEEEDALFTTDSETDESSLLSDLGISI